MAAVIANGGGYYGTGEYVEEARRMGVRILPPCINSSGIRTSGLSSAGAAGSGGVRTAGSSGIRTAGSRAGEGECEEGNGKRGAVRIGLSRIKGLSARSMEKIIAGRPYSSLAGFMSRSPIPGREVESLVRCGAMASLGASRPRLLWEYHILNSEPDGNEARRLIGRLPRLKEYGLPLRVALEMEALGFAVSAHPLAMYRNALAALARRVRLAGSGELDRLEGCGVDMAGWKVSVSGARTTGKGEEMVFVTFSDPLGRFETVFFPGAYARCAGELVKGRGPFHIRGKVQKEFGAATLVVSGIRFLGRSGRDGGPEGGSALESARGRGDRCGRAGGLPSG
jgi:error-prone DNA polymerase